MCESETELFESWKKVVLTGDRVLIVTLYSLPYPVCYLFDHIIKYIFLIFNLYITYNILYKVAIENLKIH